VEMGFLLASLYPRRSRCQPQPMPLDRAPEPNFAQLVTERDLEALVITGHALRRFVERLQPGIPRATEIAAAMAPLEHLAGHRSGPQQLRLNRYRDWMASHVEPHVRDVIRCEGFWTTERPRWSRSDKPSAGYLQVGRMCGFPAANHDGVLVLTTCTNGRDITWDIALARGYTLMPKPYTGYTPPLLEPPPWTTIAARAWRSRSHHQGFLAAFRAERAAAIKDAQRENERRRADHESAQREWQDQCDRAARAFRDRHPAG
jgi:hypothetical protein